MTYTRTLRILAALCTLTLIAAVPSFGLPKVVSGIDVFETAGGTVVSFADNPLPAGFFCPGSPVFDGQIELVGVPLTTMPAGVVGTSDTVLERLHDADLSTGSDIVKVVVRALRMKEAFPLTIQCDDGPNNFAVRSCTCGVQPTTQIEIRLDDPATGCGSFSGSLEINTCLSFVNLTTGAVAGPVSEWVKLGINDTPWCDKAGAGALEVFEPFHVDTNCDSKADLAIPGTTNFFPGWVHAPGMSCLDLYGHLTTCHSSYGTAPHEHCINPVCCGSEGISCRN